jgi:tetratricopeptide (TPR) repeat protein
MYLQIWAKCKYYFRTGDYPRAIAAGQRALTLATAHGHVALRVSTENILSMIYWYQGDYERAIDLSKRLVAFLVGDLVYERFGRSSFLSVLARHVLTHCLAERGEFADGIVSGEEAIRIAEAANHPDSYVRTYSLGYLYLCQGDAHKALPPLERGLAIC